MSRLFVALTPPEAVRAELAALAEPLVGVDWTPPANLHLTLRFIGETGPERQAGIEDALAGVRVEPFVLPVEGTGVFPARGRAKVVWVGTGHAHTRLFQLRQRVDDALLSVALDLDVRHFHPHLTLGRIRENADEKALARYLKRHDSFEAPPFRVDEFQLYASELGPGGAAYRVLRRFPL
jgi:RNA 2',3'-cyclic 3'-phosphodiesterase